MPADTWPITTLSMRNEADIVLTRQRARQVAALLGVDGLRQTRLATAVSEIARNALIHARGGRVELVLEDGQPAPQLLIRISDQGPGIPRETSLPKTLPLHGGKGAGLVIARRLCDSFSIQSDDRGTVVTLGTTLPGKAAPDLASRAAAVADALAKLPATSLIDELHRQNQDMLLVLDNLLTRQEQLLRLNEELEETNRGVLAMHGELTRELDETNHGVVALFGELDERTLELRRANGLKDQFISYLSHEFRTPIHSVIALARILLAPEAPSLSEDQQMQVRLIQKSSTSLLALIDDLLDLAKVSAGRLSVRPESFTVQEMFRALRGMMRPLVSTESVRLTLEDAPDVPPLYTDQGKLSQILRNLISNALKFTNEGVVRVVAAMHGRDMIQFRVSDTGMGIAPEDQARIFEDYEQVEGAFQRRARGTGLGLPLSRRLAQLLGGTITLESTPGIGSTFQVRIPARYEDLQPPAAPEESGPPAAAVGSEILIVDDDSSARYVLRHVLESLGCRVTEAESGEEALRLVARNAPAAIVTDLIMPGMDGLELLERLGAEPATRAIPVLIRTGKRLDDEERSHLESRAAEVLTKDEGGNDPERAAPRIAAALARIGIVPGAPEPDWQ